jgi:hypothetical protein
VPGLTQGMIDAILGYSLQNCGLFSRLNRALHDHFASAGPAAGSEVLGPWCLYLRLLSSGLSKLPPLLSEELGEVHLYRGARIPGAALASYEVHTDIYFSGFTSCSTELDVAAGFLSMGKSEDCPVVYVIRSKYGKLIAPISKYPPEQEVALRLNDHLFVESIGDGGALGLPKAVTVIHLTELKDKYSRPW